MNDDKLKNFEMTQQRFHERLLELLKLYQLKITFTKKDGSVREMLCTLNPDLLPKKESTEDKKESKSNPDILVVFDLEAQQFRSMIKANIKTCELIINNNPRQEIIF